MSNLDQDVRALLLENGASLAGCGDLRELPESSRLSLPYGLSFAVVLNPRIVSGIGAGPTIEYWHEYERVNDVLDGLGRSAAAMISAHGHRAVPLLRREMAWDRKEYTTFLPHKTVATRAGLGWIGRCALLVTRPFGAMVRISSVLTDAPLEINSPVNCSYCGKCMACVESCPGQAVSGREWTPGLARAEIFDAHACAITCDRLCQQAGIEETICGTCIHVCPWTRRYLKSAGIERMIT